MKSLKKYFPANITADQAKDTAAAFVLICLLLGLYTANFLYVKIGLVLLVISMIIPMSFRFFATVWLGFSYLLGTVVSKILLSVVFFVIVSPIGLIRRALGFDSLKLKQFKKSSRSVMHVRNYKFVAEDLERPY
ncbi:hypothetical protein EH223_16595 [candidate division KSB1 bacterium]|nr:hypothetical protein [candidate division KSB1 bacterium]RQW00966.1 MAG: hypothetical protein EH223_16595 [candidate division KSB1 bacterium]